MPLQKLPIGIQTFSDIREGNYLYIDKTDIALDVIENNKYVFLSRPRRFGKSLFLDTLKNIFEGNQELFKGLHIYDKYDWSVNYPVIEISFAAGTLHSKEDLQDKIEEILLFNEEKLGLACYDKTYDRRCFSTLIKSAYEKYNQKVVVLIDEYDKPILDNITDIEVAKEMRDGLRNLYSVIKASDAYMRFAFLTGVSKFSKVSIFSGLNNIVDISLQRRYGNICGYTHEDVKTKFKAHLQGVDLEKLKVWYNGYNFLADKVYNPFDVLLFIENEYLYKNYWFETGTPTFLIDVIKERRYFIPNLAKLEVGEEMINSFHIENIKVETLLFQAGYLTIEHMDVDEDDFIIYTLKLPNKEVKKSLHTLFASSLTDSSNVVVQQRNLLKSLKQQNLELFEKELTSLFASIANNNYTKNSIASFEGYYASVIYAYLASLGFELIAEDVTNHGRIDLSIKIENTIYIIEFKMSYNSEDALEQIKNRNYAQKYLSEGKNIYLVGIEFDEGIKNISGFRYEKLK